MIRRRRRPYDTGRDIDPDWNQSELSVYCPVQSWYSRLAD